MKILFAVAVWLVMGAVIGAGIVMAVNGKPLLLILSVVGFFVAMGRACVASH